MAKGTTENIAIRNVEMRDWARLVKLLEELLHEKPPLALELEPMLFRTEHWIENFPEEDQGVFVVAEDTTTGNVVGFCYLVKPKFRIAEAFIGIAIAKGYREQNIGSMLFYHVAEWAAKANIRAVIADIWDWNNASLNFFKELGFRQTEHFDDKFRGETKGKIRLVKWI